MKNKRTFKKSKCCQRLAGIPLSLFFIFAFFAGNVFAANVHFRDVNPIGGAPVTNSFRLQSCSTNILANGQPSQYFGIPTRFYPNTNGDVTVTGLAIGYYANLDRNYIFSVYDSSSTLYEVTNLYQSGFNIFKATIYGTNPPPTFDEVTNALQFLPLSPDDSNSLYQTIQAFGTNQTNFAKGIGTSVTNFVQTISTNGTNFSLLIGLNGTNYAATLSTNGTNFALLIGLNGTNHAATLSTNATNFAKGIGTSVTNFAQTLSTNGSNYSATLSTNATNFALSIGLNGTNYAATLSTNVTNFALLIGLNGTNHAATLSTNATNFAKGIGTSVTNFAQTLSTNGSNYSATLSTNATNFALSIGLNGTNHAATLSTNATNFAKGIGTSTTNFVTATSNSLYQAIQSASGGGILTLNGSGTNTTIRAEAGEVALKVRGESGDTEDVQQWFNGSGDTLASLNSDGTFAVIDLTASRTIYGNGSGLNSIPISAIPTFWPTITNGMTNPIVYQKLTVLGDGGGALSPVIVLTNSGTLQNRKLMTDNNGGFTIFKANSNVPAFRIDETESAVSASNITASGWFIGGNLTANRVLVSGPNQQVTNAAASPAEVNNLVGSTGLLQTNIDARLPKTNGTAAGLLVNGTFSSSGIANFNGAILTNGFTNFNATANTFATYNSTKGDSSSAASIALLTTLTDETGTGGAVFSNSPTITAGTFISSTNTNSFYAGTNTVTGSWHNSSTNYTSLANGNNILTIGEVVSVYLNGSVTTAWNLTGIIGYRKNKMLTLINGTGQGWTLVHEAASSPQSIVCPNDENLVLNKGTAVTVQFYESDQRWHVIAIAGTQSTTYVTNFISTTNEGGNAFISAQFLTNSMNEIGIKTDPYITNIHNFGEFYIGDTNDLNAWFHLDNDAVEYVELRSFNTNYSAPEWRTRKSATSDQVVSNAIVLKPGDLETVITNEDNGLYGIFKIIITNKLDNTFTTLTGTPADGWAVSGNLNATGTIFASGDLGVLGKITASGGIDPPYVLYDAHTRAETKTRVLAEVIPAKRSGAAQFWNPGTHRLEIYVASEDKFYDLDGNELSP